MKVSKAAEKWRLSSLFILYVRLEFILYEWEEHDVGKH